MADPLVNRIIADSATHRFVESVNSATHHIKLANTAVRFVGRPSRANLQHAREWLKMAERELNNLLDMA